MPPHICRTRNARAPTSPRSIGFCAIWESISSSSSSQPGRGGSELAGIGHRDPEWHLQGVDSAYLAPSLRPHMAVGSCQLPIGATGALLGGAGVCGARAARGVSAGGRAAERGRAWPMGMIGPP